MKALIWGVREGEDGLPAPRDRREGSSSNRGTPTDSRESTPHDTSAGRSNAANLLRMRRAGMHRSERHAQGKALFDGFGAVDELS